MFDDDFLYDCSPAGLAFQELLEEDLTSTPAAADHQPSQTTVDTVPAVSSKKRFQQCQPLVTQHPSSLRSNACSAIIQAPQSAGILAEIDQAIQESFETHEEEVSSLILLLFILPTPFKYRSIRLVDGRNIPLIL